MHFINILACYCFIFTVNNSILKKVFLVNHSLRISFTEQSQSYFVYFDKKITLCLPREFVRKIDKTETGINSINR
ncbi:hypothetical protein DJ013_02625 [Arcticibacterium luteifluviistationis]|uniref:Uncharacterized protein n=1 Tax=Arcticibacterium luteifluviistationis TaxID=1784714 RepID=A0A2Z4G7E8_9BACT|nr:hypothetical protein DJ013_02625 [Arcticibacterium luteifluviistationis]